jgi:hypothetical protein
MIQYHKFDEDASIKVHNVGCREFNHLGLQHEDGIILAANFMGGQCVECWH